MQRKLKLSLMLGLTLSVCAVDAQSLLDQDFADPTNLKQYLDSAIESNMKDKGIPGVILSIVKDGQLVVSGAYGVPELGSSTAVSYDKTLFRIGSITKVFTGIALMQLIEAGKVSMHDDVNQYLPDDLKIKDRYTEPVRVWHLMSHTAGFDQILSGRIFESSEERHSLKEALEGKMIRIRPSGLVSCYDTYGIMLAGVIIEQVSGKSYAQYIEDHIFTPLGMNDSYVDALGKTDDILAKGYRPGANGLEEQAYEWYSSTPASSIDATAADMARFMMAVLGKAGVEGGRLLSEEYGELLLKTTFANHPDYPGYANTFWEQFIQGIRTVGHGGVMQGYQSNLVIVPEHNIGIYIAYNLESESIDLRSTLVKNLFRRWFPLRKVEPIKASEAFKVETAQLTGVYASNLYCHTCYEGEGAGRSITSVSSEGPGHIKLWGLNFYALTPTSFKSESGKTRIEFKKNERGEVRHLLVSSTNYVYEKVGQPLIDEVLGYDYPKDSITPLHAMTYRALNDLPKTIAAYRHIAERRPEDGAANYYLGTAYRSNKQPEEAIKALSKAFELGRWRTYSAITIADIYLNDLNNKEGALKWANTAIDEGLPKEAIIRNGALKGIADQLK